MGFFSGCCILITARKSETRSVHVQSMSLRRSLKIPRNGLFFFEIDNSTCVLATKRISKVLEGDNKTKGSKVLVQYGTEELEATIIGVSGNETCCCRCKNFICILLCVRQGIDSVVLSSQMIPLSSTG